MPLYTYKYIDKSGKAVTASTEAAGRDLLAESLIRSGFSLISIEEKKPGLDTSFIDSFFARFRRVKTNDLVMFTVQLSNMLNAGLSLPLALSTLAEQTENPLLKSITEDLIGDIRQGKTFSESLAKHKEVFSNLFINMVAAGEVSGNLDEILSRLASFTEHEQELKQRISSAMMYPMVLIVAAILVVSFVVTSMLPPFVKIFNDSGVPLPLPTKILYGLNLLIRGFWPYIVAACVAAYFGLKQWANTPDGKMRIDTFKINLPVWGDLLKKVEIARLSRTLSALLSSGVPMLQALQVTEKTVDVAPIALVIRNVGTSVGKGRNISDSLRESPFFPPMPVHMIAVGEETGTLEKMLNKIADFYDLATDYAIKKLTTLLEPMFLVIIGGIVAFIFASILLPIFNMVNTLKR